MEVHVVVSSCIEHAFRFEGQIHLKGCDVLAVSVIDNEDVVRVGFRTHREIDEIVVSAHALSCVSGVVSAAVTLNFLEISIAENQVVSSLAYGVAVA